MLKRLLLATPLFLTLVIGWSYGWASLLSSLGFAAGTAVTLQPAASGGTSSLVIEPTGATNQDATVVKGSGGQVYHISLGGSASYITYVKFYNLTSCTSSSGTPQFIAILPANTNGTGNNIDFATGKAFPTGICVRATQGIADSDATAVTSGFLVINIDYN